MKRPPHLFSQSGVNPYSETFFPAHIGKRGQFAAFEGVLPSQAGGGIALRSYGYRVRSEVGYEA